MVDVAQLVRVADCGSEGRGFESHLPPEQNKRSRKVPNFGTFCFLVLQTQACLKDVVTKNEGVDLSTFCEVRGVRRCPCGEQ